MSSILLLLLLYNMRVQQKSQDAQVDTWTAVCCIKYQMRVNIYFGVIKDNSLGHSSKNVTDTGATPPS